MPKIAGPMTVTFENAANNEFTAFALGNVTLNIEHEAIDRAHPTNLDWEQRGQGQLSWRGQLSYNVAVDSAGLPNTAQAQMETLAFAKTQFVIQLDTSLKRYIARCFVEKMQYSSADQQVYRVDASLVGNQIVEAANSGALDWCPNTVQIISYWGSPGLPLFLGPDPGWVKISDYPPSAPMSAIQVFDSDLNTLVTLSRDPYLLTDDHAWFYWNPPLGGPYTVTFGYTPFGVPFNPVYYTLVQCPAETS